jgi:uncharacterized protein YuzE
MKISYDSEVDAMYIEIISGDYECRTLRFSDQIALDIGPDEQLVGIEILDAKKVLGMKSPATIEIHNVLAKTN